MIENILRDDFGSHEQDFELFKKELMSGLNDGNILVDMSFSRMSENSVCLKIKCGIGLSAEEKNNIVDGIVYMLEARWGVDFCGGCTMKYLDDGYEYEKRMIIQNKTSIV